MPDPHPTLKLGLQTLALSAGEHDLLAACAAQALDAAERATAGSRSAPLTPADLLRLPRLLGYLAVAAVRHPRLSTGAKVKLARYTLERIDPLEDEGTPHGLMVVLSALAAAAALDLATFTRIIKLAEIERALFDAITLDELLLLSGWLLARIQLDDRQRLWWLWFLVGNCQEQCLGQPWIDALLTHPALSQDFKRRLCQAWLSPRPPGPAPAGWWALDQALTARLTGEAADNEDDDLAALNVASHLMRGALGGYVLMPEYVQRRAAWALAELGNEPAV